MFGARTERHSTEVLPSATLIAWDGETVDEVPAGVISVPVKHPGHNAKSAGGLTTTDCPGTPVRGAAHSSRAPCPALMPSCTRCAQAVNLEGTCVVPSSMLMLAPSVNGSSEM